jgi:hypothetical protein
MLGFWLFWEMFRSATPVFRSSAHLSRGSSFRNGARRQSFPILLAQWLKAPISPEEVPTEPRTRSADRQRGEILLNTALADLVGARISLLSQLVVPCK